ncbi:glycosyl transferase, partial [Vibrio cholerae]
MVEHGVEFETTFQNEKRIRVPLYRKPTREIYSVYKKIRMMMFANEYKK